MRLITFSILTGLFLISCASKKTEEKQAEVKEDAKTEELKKPIQDGVQTDGAYREFYTNGKVKIEGFLDQKGDKNGVWKGFSENGWQQSEIFYLAGKKNGHAIVFHPNGKPKYIGEYKNDIKTGHWRFFDEEGNLTKEVDFE